MQKVVPRASVSLTHPALAAAYGGALPVKPASSEKQGDEYELLDPRFNLVVSLASDQSLELYAGQRIDVTCRPQHYSVGRHLYHQVSSWLNKRLEE